MNIQRYEQTSRTLTVSSKGMEFVEKVSPVNVPEPCSLQHLLKPHQEKVEDKKGEIPKTQHKPSKHFLPGVKEMMEDSSTWVKCVGKEYQYPGFDTEPGKLLYVENCKQLPQSSQFDTHFLYNDIQLSRGPANKPSTKQWFVDGASSKFVIKKSGCEGVKSCLIQTVGQNKAFSVLKGCQLHWMRSVLRVSSRVCQSEDEQFVFKAIGRAIPLAETEEDVLKMLDVLCGRAKVSELDGIVKFEDVSSSAIINTHWNRAECWCQWWMQERHLKLLCEATTDMNATVWDTTPFTTNAVESKNRLSVPSSKGSSNLLLQLEHQYRMDRLATKKHVAAEHDVMIHHRSDSQEALARRAMAKATWRRQKFSKTSDNSGPPETVLEASPVSARGKRPSPSQHKNSRSKKTKTELLGRLVSVECIGDDKVALGWFDARIESYHKSLGYLLRFLANEGEYIYAKKIPDKDIKLL
ncbi:hypothetical protein ACROYT_G017805 [Oculina patagonica]